MHVPLYIIYVIHTTCIMHVLRDVIILHKSTKIYYGIPTDAIIVEFIDGMQNNGMFVDNCSVYTCVIICMYPCIHTYIYHLCVVYLFINLLIIPFVITTVYLLRD